MTALDVLIELLQRADLRGGELKYVGHVEVSHWLSEVFECIDTTGLLSVTSDAELTFCHECLEPHLEQVVYTTDAAGASLPAIRCPTHGRVFIDRADLKRWRLDLGAFAGALAWSLGGKTRELLQGRCWSLGSLALGQAVVSLYLVRGASWPDGPETFETTCRLSTGAAVFHLGLQTAGRLPTTVRWTPLSEALRLEANQIVFRPDLALASTGRLSEYSIRRTGKLWQLTFAGESGMVPDRLGLSYISQLLTYPRRDFDALELSAVEASLLPGGVNPEDMTESSSGTDDEIMDDEYRTSVLARLGALDAKKSQHGLTAEEAQEGDVLRQQLTASLAIGGRPRRFPTETGNVRIRVSQAIRRAIEVIRPVLPGMAEHLETFVSTGSTLCYAPDDPVSWQT